MIFNPERECMERSDQSELQISQLRKVVERVYAKVPFYKKKLDAAGVSPSDLQSIEDIAKLPFTEKTELRDVYPYGLLACDESEIVEVHTSSGTTGTPVVGAYTIGDIETWSEATARTLAMAGTGPNDVVQNGYGYGLFTGAWESTMARERSAPT